MGRVLFSFLFILFNVCTSYSKTVPVDSIKLSDLIDEYELSEAWLYNLNDSEYFSQSLLIDTGWHQVKEAKSQNLLDSLFSNPPFSIWYRLHISIDDSLNGKILALRLIIKDACEIFVDGVKVKTIGKIPSNNEKGISGFNLKPVPIPMILNKGGHVIAIHYFGFSEGNDQRDVQFDVMNSPIGFQSSLSTIEKAFERYSDTSDLFIYAFFSGIFITLSLFHFILFLYYRSNRSNLYYSLFSFLLFIIFFGIYKITSGSDLYMTTKLGMLEAASILCVPLLFIALLYQIFYKRILIYLWILSGVVITGMILVAYSKFQSAGGVLILLYIISGFIEILRIYIKAWRQKKEGAGIFLFGILVPPVGTIALSLLAYILNKLGLDQTSLIISNSLSSFFGYTMLLSVSISMTIYLANDFSRINLKLAQQLAEIKQLFQKTIFQEHEKKRILENQNIELEKKVKERTSELATKNKAILDNLQYAQRIQSAILPESSLIYKTLKDSFILYRPKDIVSGDFYSFSQKNGKVVISAADCTGHGVTGAFLSMIGISQINQIVNENGVIEPAQILNLLNNGIVHALKQRETDTGDGMDIAICSIDLQNRTVQYAGANRPLYIIRKGDLEEIKPDKLAIGGFRLNKDALFTNHSLELSEGDIVYIFSDGYVDQFGGEQGKKMLSKRLREFLISIKNLPMQDQGNELEKYFDNWKGNMEQVDDVLLIGIRI